MLPLKLENLSCCSTKLIHFCKKLLLVLVFRQSKYSFYIHIFFSYGMAFAVPFLFYLQKLQLLVKEFWTNFYCILFLFLWAEKVCLRFVKSYFKLQLFIFLKSYFKLQLFIFLFFVLSLSVGMFNQKAPFLIKETAVKPETHFSREAIEN